MRVVDISLAEYRVPLRAGDARRRWSERRGLLVRMRDEDGRLGQGEAAPLPGVSPDNLEDCRSALDDIAKRCPVELDESPPPNLPPAAAFAFETAILDLGGQRSARSIAQMFVSSPRTVPLAALVTGDTAATLIEAARAAVARGIRTLKLKVGRDLSAQWPTLRRIREVVGPDVALRFDANGVWDVAEARANLAALAELRPEFVEDPVAAAAWPDIGPAAVPLAVDEALGTPHEGAALVAAGVCVAVLKPTRLGGLRACRVRAGSIDVVVGHLYEGPIAMAAAAALALTLPRVRACGLDSHAALDSWGVAAPQFRGDLLVDAGPGLGLPVATPPGV